MRTFIAKIREVVKVSETRDFERQNYSKTLSLGRITLRDNSDNLANKTRMNWSNSFVKQFY